MWMEVKSKATLAEITGALSLDFVVLFIWQERFTVSTKVGLHTEKCQVLKTRKTFFYPGILLKDHPAPPSGQNVHFQSFQTLFCPFAKFVRIFFKLMFTFLLHALFLIQLLEKKQFRCRFVLIRWTKMSCLLVLPIVNLSVLAVHWSEKKVGLIHKCGERGIYR